MVAEHVGIDGTLLAVPALVVGHREHEADVRVPLRKLLQHRVEELSVQLESLHAFISADALGG